MPAFACVRLPDSLSDAEGALVEPTEVAVRAVNKAPPRLGDVVAVLGGGTIGLLTLQVSRAAGAGEVVVVEPRPARRALALELGAAAALDPADPGWMDELRRRAGGLGPDVVFECAGRPDSASLAIRMARKGGRIVLVGITGGQVPVDTLDLLIGEKTVIGTIQHHYDEDLPAAVRLLADGRVRGRPLVTAEIPLARRRAGRLRGTDVTGAGAPQDSRQPALVTASDGRPRSSVAGVRPVGRWRVSGTPMPGGRRGSWDSQSASRTT